MRIIGGIASGRLLKVPKGFDVRPTPDLVRQAIFNSLADRVVDARVLELFGGTGALSLESLSRGATSATCIELAGRHAKIIKDNHQGLGLGDLPLETITKDVFVVLPVLAERGEKFDLIMADPPFGDKNVNQRSKSFSQKLLDHPALPELLAEGGTFVLGHAARDTVELPDCWHERKFMRHGDSAFRFLERAENE